MLDCWHQTPSLRPSFSHLVLSLDAMLETIVTEVSIDNSLRITRIGFEHFICVIYKEITCITNCIWELSKILGRH